MRDVLTPYRELVAAIQVDQIVCSFIRPHQLTVSTQTGPIWPDAGNSFWVTHATGEWTIFSWSPVGYSIADPTDLPRFCRTCVVTGSRAMHLIPDELVKEFGLKRLSGEEEKRVILAMTTAEWPSAK